MCLTLERLCCSEIFQIYKTDHFEHSIHTEIMESSNYFLCCSGKYMYNIILFLALHNYYNLCAASSTVNLLRHWLHVTLIITSLEPLPMLMICDPPRVAKPSINVVP